MLLKEGYKSKTVTHGELDEWQGKMEEAAESDAETWVAEFEQSVFLAKTSDWDSCIENLQRYFLAAVESAGLTSHLDRSVEGESNYKVADGLYSAYANRLEEETEAVWNEQNPEAAMAFLG